MSINALLSVARSSCASGFPNTLFLQMANTGTSAVTLTSVTTTISPQAPGQQLFGNPTPNLNTVASPVTIPAAVAGVNGLSPTVAWGITLNTSWPSQTPSGSLPSVYMQQNTVQVFCLFSDGTSASSNIITINVTPYEQPQLGLPLSGQTRFDSNQLSGLLAAVTIPNL